MKALQDMSKLELEAYAQAEFGVDLNRASSKENLIKEIRAMEHAEKQAPVEEADKDTLVRNDSASDKSTAEVVTDGVALHRGFSGEEVPPDEPDKLEKKAKPAKVAKLSGFDKVLKDMQVEANDASMKELHHPDCHSYGTNPQCDYCDPSLPGADDLFKE